MSIYHLQTDIDRSEVVPIFRILAPWSPKCMFLGSGRTVRDTSNITFEIRNSPLPKLFFVRL